MKLIALLAALLFASIDGAFVNVTAQEKPAPSDRAARPLIRVPTALPLEEARVIVEAAKAVVKAENGRAAIAVVDFNGNLVSLDVSSNPILLAGAQALVGSRHLPNLAALGLAGIDPAYRDARAGVAAAHYRISEDEFVRRTNEVAPKCLVDKLAGRDLVRCYSRVLQTGG